MNRFRYSLLVCISMIVITSACKKNYLDTNPTNAIADEAAVATTTNAMGALNGIHRLLYSQWLGNQDQGGVGAVYIYSDMMGDDLVMTTAGNGWFNGSYQWLDHRNVNSRVPQFNWYFFYRIISNANLIINKIDNASGPATDKKAIKAEALTFRAWSHFMLVQTFGKRYDEAGNNTQLGVPILTVNTVEGQPRATVDEVYAQINKDLDEAIVNFAGYNRTNKSHFNINVAKGIKARVALTQGKWAEAATLAAEARAGFNLMSNAQYLEGFNSINNPEWIWGSAQVADQSTFFYSYFAYMSANFSSTNIRTNPKAINSNLYKQISPSDVRKQLWDSTGKNTAFPTPAGGARYPYMNRKFLAASSNSSIGDVPNMRAAEMYLIEAEAKARLGQTAAAQDILFTLVTNRDPAYMKSTNTGQGLIDEILLQRRLELWGEGFRWFDLKRLNLGVDRQASNHKLSLARIFTIAPGDKEWEYLIPQAEINANPAMVQNPL